MPDKQPQSSPGETGSAVDPRTERLIAEKRGAAGWITFNNQARRNAMSVDMWEAIPKVLDRFEADDDVRVIVLTGAGSKAFVSGADISQFETQRAAAEAVEYYEEISETAQERLQKSNKPVIAMIRGFCLGAGVNIALACDLRLAADDARFAVPAARMGLGYRVSSTKNLVDAVGAANAREMLLTARHVTAEEAKAMGLVHRVSPASDLEALVADYCSMIAANAPLTMRTAKHVIRELLRSSEGFDAEGCAAMIKQCFESEDYTEGRRAFMEKRKPVFAGK